MDKHFQEFWALYPKKTNKAGAFKAFKKTLPFEFGDIMVGLTLQINLKQWQDKQFIPHASTWLNQRRWEDEFDDSEFVDLKSGLELDYAF